jgi:hypothetical protein
MVDENEGDQLVPIQEGQLATGGTGMFNSRDVSQLPLGAMMGMLGLGGGKVPTGKDYVPSATWKDGKFQMADLYDLSKMHPMWWKLAQFLGNTALPGAGSIGNAVVQQGVPRGIGDGVPNNASIRRLNR